MRAQHFIKRVLACAFVFAIAGAVGDRTAQVSENDASPESSFTPYVDRTIPMPPLVFLTSLKLTANRPDPREGRSSVGVGLGFATGIVDRLTAEAAFGPMELAPEARLGNLTLGLLYDLINAYPFELEPTVHVTVRPWGGQLFSQIEPGVMLALHHEHELRIDTGVYVPIALGEKTKVL